MIDKKLNILVLASGKAELLTKTIEERGHNFTLAHPWDFDLYLSDNTKGFDALYLFGEKFISSKYDAVISRVGTHRDFSSKILHHLKENLNVYCVQSGESIEICADKFKAAQIMSKAHIQVPRQFFSINPQSAQTIVEKLGGLPIILKELSGSKGKGLILLESPLQTNMTLESYLGSERKIILQEYLNNGGTDERHIVCNGKVVNSMKRIAPNDDIRANLSRNGRGEKIEADPETAAMCVKIVNEIPGLNFAGVDIMKCTTPKGPVSYFIEVNSNPGELIIDITGHNHYIDLLEYVESHVSHKKRDPEQSTNKAEERGGLETLSLLFGKE